MNRKSALTTLYSKPLKFRFIKSNLGVADNLEIEKYLLVKDKLQEELVEVDK